MANVVKTDETSHGGTWDDAPESIKQWALKHGFNGASAPAADDNSANNWALLGLGAAALGGLLFAPEITIPVLVLGGATSTRAATTGREARYPSRLMRLNPCRTLLI